MLRSLLLYLSNQPQIFRFVRNNRLAKSFARRFVAGETLDEALDAVRVLNAKGISASLDELGESVTNEAEARGTRDTYLRILDRIAESKLDANVSVKLTALGLDISEDLCVVLMQDLLERARKYGTFVRIDMESSAYTERTLRLFEERFYPSYREQVGIVLQSYLYRTAADVRTRSRRAWPSRTRRTWTRATCAPCRR
jgi:proline dehydrogenase